MLDLSTQDAAVGVLEGASEVAEDVSLQCLAICEDGGDADVTNAPRGCVDHLRMRPDRADLDLTTSGIDPLNPHSPEFASADVDRVSQNHRPVVEEGAIVPVLF